MPDAPSFIGGHVNLESVFARVAGSRDAGPHAAHFTIFEMVVADAGQVRRRHLLKRIDALGALDRYLGIALARKLNLGVKAVRRIDVLEVFFLVRSVDADEIVVVVDLVHQDVVNEAAMTVK